jgi:hypothetical protein
VLPWTNDSRDSSQPGTRTLGSPPQARYVRFSMTEEIAAVVSLIALFLTAISARAAHRSAVTAERTAVASEKAIELNAGITPYLTDATGEKPRVEVSEDALRLWVTNWGMSGMRIFSADLAYRGPKLSRWAAFVAGKHRVYAVERAIGTPNKRLLVGGGPDAGRNVTEICVPLIGNPAVAWTGDDPGSLRDAIRNGGDIDGELAIEFEVLAIRLGVRTRYAVVVEGFPSGWWSIDFHEGSILDGKFDNFRV